MGIIINFVIKTIIFTAFLFSLKSFSQTTVNFQTLLKEVADRTNIASYPKPEYQLGQFSSYDRATTQPGKPSWFANWDRSMFVRVEEKKGRKEYVLFDTIGPGAVVRFWMTFAGEDSGNGILRFYIDGNKEPEIKGPAKEIISGTGLINGILATSVSDSTDYSIRGHNLYLPIPYSKSLKITYETENIKDSGAKTGGEAVYYNINYRTYKEADVKSFSLETLHESQSLLEDIQQKLLERNRGLENEKLSTLPIKEHIAAGESFEINLPSGQNAVRHFELKLSSSDLEQALRSTILKINFDGQETVWSPVGDFFGTGYQIRESNTWYSKVDDNGQLSVWWVMPYERKAKLILQNLNDTGVIVEGMVETSTWAWDDRSMHFGARWHQYTNLFTGEMKNNEGEGGPFDINYVELEGKGVYVGDVITLYNTVYAWWGEGDEKIYIDGESFPSHIGTGTEDYYGYAWVRPEKFSNHPFIAQPDGSGNVTPGYTVNMRYRGLDGIPFEESLKVDMEMWHWTRSHINFAPVTFHYMIPNGKTNITPDIENAKSSVVLRRSDLISPLIKNGKIEAESMILENSTAGNFRYQNSEKFGWSDNMQVFWSDVKAGDKLTLNFISEKSGEFMVSSKITFGPDSSKLNIKLNGKTASNTVNAYHDEIIVKNIELGKFNILKGENTLEIQIKEVRGDNKNSSFGLDYLLLTQ